MNQEIAILVVEENLLQAEQLRHILERHNYKVSVEPNAMAALDEIGRTKPQIIISAIHLPEIDGHTFCRKIKEDENLRDISVILLTSLSDTKDVISGLACGADNFVSKPYDEDLLISRVEYTVHNRELRTGKENQNGLRFVLDGEKYSIASERHPLVDILISTYETAVQKNIKLLRAEEELKALNDRLKIEVEERTSELMEQIVERKLTEQALIESESLLMQSQKMEAVGRLAGGVAHDFNNILTVIMGYSEMLLNSMTEGDDLYRYAEQVKMAGERAASLTQQLLAFSRQQVLQPRVLDLNSIVSGIEKMLERLIGEDIELESFSDMDLGQVRADPGQVEQILLNLAVNARDAMPYGGKLTIRTANVTLDEEEVTENPGMLAGLFVKLSVGDTGCGMDPEQIPHIFEPFFTTKEQGRGTGLGLSTVYGIVKQSGGFIQVDSQPGKGTVFEILFPLLREAVDVVKPPAAASTPLHGKETILLVEDDHMVRAMAQHILQLNGYTVLHADKGGSALLCCLEHQGSIDLMLTDVVMPEMSGPELASRLRADYPGMKVLFMSGYADDTRVQHGLSNRDIEFLPKPFTWDGLVRKVREVLDSPVAV